MRATTVLALITAGIENMPRYVCASGLPKARSCHSFRDGRFSAELSRSRAYRAHVAPVPSGIIRRSSAMPAR